MALSGPLARLRPSRLLTLDLSRPVVDDPSMPPIARTLRRRGPELREVLETLEHAGQDPRVVGLVARVDAPATSWAHAQELHAAITSFREHGKLAIAHAQSLSEAGEPTLAFLVATAFDEIHLQPTGELAATGVAMTSPFLAELLEKLDLKPEFDHRHEYKSAKNLFTERDFTDAHHEAADRIVASLHEQLVGAIATGRGLSRADVAAALDLAPLSADDAVEWRLVDELAYRDQTVASVRARLDDDVQLTPLDRYQQASQRRGWRPNRPRIALIHGEGGIQVGRSRRGASGPVMGSDTVSLGFSQAIRDDHVRAIVFRVESGGGSVVASDAILRAVLRAREAGKPVVVTMGGVAGSGGYWVAMGADRIIASPGTITGSIGVVYGKIVTSGLLERVGIGTGIVQRGENALMTSSTRSFTDDQWEHVQRFLDRVYDRFVDEVASHRQLHRDHVHRVARGRIWTGADALEHGLVDGLGGYPEAFVSARRLAGLEPDRPVKVEVLPDLALPEKLGLRQPVDDDAAALVRGVATLARGVRAPRGARSEVPGWATGSSTTGGR